MTAALDDQIAELRRTNVELHQRLAKHSAARRRLPTRCVQTRNATPWSPRPSPKAFTIGTSILMRSGCRRA